MSRGSWQCGSRRVTKGSLSIASAWALGACEPSGGAGGKESQCRGIWEFLYHYWKVEKAEGDKDSQCLRASLHMPEDNTTKILFSHELAKNLV